MYFFLLLFQNLVDLAGSERASQTGAFGKLASDLLSLSLSDSLKICESEQSCLTGHVDRAVSLSKGPSGRLG